MDLPKTGDTLLGKYVLEHVLGEGGMGVVYAARHDLLGQRVAIKLIRPEFAVRDDAVGRFLNEARAAARIQNEHVARVLDVGKLANGLPYMVLEYLAGSDLGRILLERGRLPIADVADYVLQAIEAVAHAHALGIVHRDLKPSNLFLAKRQDGTTQVKVFDFGISKIMGGAGAPASMTKTNALLGSPFYMSPEQLRDSKSVDHRSDIWAFGVVAYELLTGQVPFVADNAVALFAAIQEQEPSSPSAARPDVTPALDAIILKCLQRRRDDRFTSVTELGLALAPFGSVVAARAYENTSRILPLGEATVSNLASTTNPTLASATNAMVENVTAAMPVDLAVTPAGLSGRITADAVSTPARAPTKTPANTMVVVGVVGLAVAALLVVLFFARDRSVSSASPDAAQSSALASSVVTAPSVVPSTASSAAAAATATATTTPTTEASPASPSSAAANAPATTTTTTTTSPIAQTAPLPGTTGTTKPRPTALVDAGPHASAATPVAAAPAAPAPAPAAPARPNCNPPYEFDATGKKVWKRDCL